MLQFSIVDKVDLFRKTSKLVCCDLISTFVSKEKLQRDYRKLEKKLKNEQAKKKKVQIKKMKLEKKIVEMNKETGNNTLNILLKEKDAETHNLKKKLRIPHEAHVQTTKLKTALQEKEVLEN
jgi:hypothetical protein